MWVKPKKIDLISHQVLISYSIINLLDKIFTSIEKIFFLYVMSIRDV